MSAMRPQPEVGVHRLRTAILQAVADSKQALHGTDVVEKFAKSGWTFPPSVKDVRHAVRWLEGRGLVEWRKAPHGPGKELRITSAGHEAAHQGLLGLLGPSQPTQGDAERSASASPPTRRGGRTGFVGGPTVGRHLPSLVRNSDDHVRCLPC